MWLGPEDAEAGEDVDVEPSEREYPRKPRK